MLPSRRLVSFFVLCGLLPVLVLTYASLTLSRQALRSEVDSRINTSLVGSRIQVLDQLTNITRAVSAAGRSTPVVEAVASRSRDRQSQAVDELAGSHPSWLTLALTDPAGAVTTSAQGRPGLATDDITATSWFRAAARSPTVVVGDTQLSAGTRVIAIAVAVQGRVAGAPVRTVGYLVALVSVRTMQTAVDELHLTAGTSTTVVDQFGTVVAEPGLADDVLRSRRSEKLTAAALAGRSGRATVAIGGEDYLTAYAPVAPYGWAIVTQVSDTVAYDGLNRLQRTVLTIAGWLVLMVLIGFVASIRGERTRRRDAAVLQLRSAELEASERRFRTAFFNSPVGMLRVSLGGMILETNPAFNEMLGYPQGALTDVSLSDITYPDDRAKTNDRLRQNDAEGQITRLEKRYLHAQGHAVWVIVETSRLSEAAGRDFFFGQVIDISDRKAAEAALSVAAMHDSLTGLPNRLQLENRIANAMLGWHPDAEFSPAVLFVDLDGFKAVNDALGHRAGDDVLQEIALRLQHVVRPVDTVCRLGGDEFVILCTELPTGENELITQIGERIVLSVSQPGSHGDGPWRIGASVGAAWPLRVGESPSSLLSRADQAMYRAKRLGKGRIEFAHLAD